LEEYTILLYFYEGYASSKHWLKGRPPLGHAHKNTIEFVRQGVEVNSTSTAAGS